MENRPKNVGHGFLWFYLLLQTFVLGADVQETRWVPPEASLNFHTLSVDDGLSQSTIYSILQDRFGFMWFATQDGLNRFDGREFTVYRSARDGLPESFIYSLAEDRAGNIWIGTQSRGVSCFERERGTFTHYSVHDQTSGLPSDQVNFMMVDRRDQVWVATETGVCVLDRKRGVFQPVPVSSAAGKILDNLKIRTMAEDDAGGIWLGGEHHLLRYDPNTTELGAHFQNAEIRLDIYTLSADPRGFLWLGTNNHGLVRYTVASGAFASFSTFDAGQGDSVWSLQPAPGDRLWIGTENGLVLGENMLAEHPTFRRFKRDPLRLRSLPGDVVYSLYRDRAEQLWIGTVESGLAVLSPSFRAVQCYTTVPVVGAAEGMPLGRVSGFGTDAAGNSWLTSEHGVFRWDRGGGGFVPFVPRDPALQHVFREQRFEKMQGDPAGRLWVSSGNGLWRIEPATGVAKRVPFQQSSEDTAVVISALRAYQGRMWVAVYGRGLAWVDLETQDVAFVSDTETQGDPLSVFVTDMAGDDQGRLWVTTQDSGLYCYDTGTGIARNFRYDPKNPHSPPTNALSQVVYVNEQDLWLGGLDRGLIRFNPGTGSVKALPKHLRFDNWAVNALYHDHQERLWLSGNAGLATIDLSAGRVRTFSAIDNLQGREFSTSAIHASGDGLLWFGGLNGFNLVDTRRFSASEKPGGVMFTGFTLNDRSPADFPSAESLNHARGAQPVTLSYRDRRVSFEFALPGAPLEEPILFYSKLEGWDDGWQVHKPNRAVATYTNLKSGDYVFKVRAEHRDGHWRTEESSLRISMPPPPWLRWWAFVLYALPACMLVALAYQTLRQKLVLERNLNEQLRQNDRFKDEFTQSLEHKLAARTQQLEESNHQLKKSNNEMMLVEQIVLAINEQLEIKPLLQTVTDKSLGLFSNAEAALFLLRDGRSERFLAVAGSGFKEVPSATDFLTEDTLIRQFTNNGRRLIPGITVLRSFPGWRDEPSLSKFREPKVLLCLGVGVSERVLGFLIFFHYGDAEAFDIQDNQRLSRLSQHLASALIKAQMMEELKAKNSEILRTQRQLITQEKMASLGTLTTGIAHEMRNPLNFVTNFAEVSRELLVELEEAWREAAQDEAEQERLSQIFEELIANAETIHKHGTRAASIVQSMMDLVRGPSGTWQETELNGIVWEFSQLAYRGFRARDELFYVAFDYALDENLTHLEANPKDLRRLVINLVNNAIEAATESKHAESDEVSPQVWLRTHGDDRRVVFEVGNNGGSFSPEIKEQMFNPFFTTKGSNSGHIGLGLSICYDIVAQHKGSIDAEIDSDGLTWFRVVLPRARRADKGSRPTYG
ncbi:sensor histidine kinase [Acanthopleuribacter pedis]|uniref:histidine kinase n=1 Tax=Acanthopleuribacter pedis TaxID=442870 RepID=A0A8J7U213_9BACT|nr:two-component regulator propeller domain-containing protein [Acanthopleuribacter pedis]MBO1318122.1 GHKL domain-containing protein [Acanthopleuribacter pedis]